MSCKGNIYSYITIHIYRHIIYNIIFYFKILNFTLLFGSISIYLYNNKIIIKCDYWV